MSDLSASPQTTPEAVPAAEQTTRSFWLNAKKIASRVQDWFVIQSPMIKAIVLVVAVLIPATGIYSVALLQKQAAVAEQVKAMSVDKAGDARWTFNEKLPVVFGTGPVLSFLQ